jgi:hypothetical protein
MSEGQLSQGPEKAVKSLYQLVVMFVTNALSG